MEENNPEISKENLRICLPKQLRTSRNEISDPVYKIQLTANWQEPGKLKPTIDTTDWIAIKFSRSHEKVDIDELNKEYKLLSLANGESDRRDIVSVFRLFDDCINQEPPFFVMEFGERSMEKFFKFTASFPTGREEDFQKDEHYYTIRRGLIWLQQIAGALDYLHGRKILHRDLKPGNVLLFEDSTLCKLCDFGNSTNEIKTNRTGGRGTSHYMAPEMTSASGKCLPYTKKVDMYSFGIVMHECLCTRVPTANFSLPDGSMFGRYADEKYEFNKLKDLMRRLTSETPEQRPETLLVHLEYLELDPGNLPGLFTNVPELPAIEVQGDNFSQRSLSRRGRTIYYSVVIETAQNPSSAEESSVQATDSERRLITETLSGIRRQINTKAAEHHNRPTDPYNVTNELNVHPARATKPGEFCQVEHIVTCSDETHERAVFDYCCTVDGHLIWLREKFREDPSSNLRNMKFLVDMDVSNQDNTSVPAVPECTPVPDGGATAEGSAGSTSSSGLGQIDCLDESLRLTAL